MGRPIEEIAVRREDLLRAIAVMDVEIDNRNALGIIMYARIKCGDSGIVEQAEAHGPARFGMMSGRPYRAEGIVRLAVEHCIDGGDSCSHPTQSRL